MWKALSLLLLLSITGCRQPGAPSVNPGETVRIFRGVLVAVGGNGSIARSFDGGNTWSVNMPRPTKQNYISGDLQVSGNLQVIGNFSQGQNQSGQVNMGIGNAGYPGDLYVRGHIYQGFGEA